MSTFYHSKLKLDNRNLFFTSVTIVPFYGNVLNNCNVVPFMFVHLCGRVLLCVISVSVSN
uniref:Uncharacterized protein n=1 Tax=Anguilla anguilla TaxID=7936 RepID=A0A0E9QVW1_ANGAN